MNRKTSSLASMTLAIFALTLFCASNVYAQTETVLHNFAGNGSDGSAPYAGVIFDSAGNLYGTTYGGGVLDCDGLSGCGTVFELKPNPDGTWSEALIYLFPGGPGAGGNPVTPAVFDRHGNLFGTILCSFDCGGLLNGNVYELMPESNGSWQYQSIYSANGDCEPCWVAFDPAGRLFVSSQNQAYRGDGVVFSLAPLSIFAWYQLFIYGFTGGSDGGNPAGPLVFDRSGGLYGATNAGGSNGLGVIYKLKQNTGGVRWTQSVLYSFQGGTDGATPLAGPVFGADGNLYGTTAQGGTPGAGIVYKLTRNPNGTWTETVLYSFQGNGDASGPNSAVSFDNAGNLYGTAGGGAYQHGAVFKLAPAGGGRWTESVLYSFTGGLDGGDPSGGVILDNAANLYGTTQHGGAYPTCNDEPRCGGVVFKITP
jgi:uncharacterized repeat protein (TIGR03803 family)